MDWKKAKNIIIVALIITNLILGGVYIGKLAESKLAVDKAATNTKEYLEELGVAVDTKIPTTIKKLPVLFVTFSSLAEDAEAPETCRYKGLDIEISGGGFVDPASIKPGDSKLETCTASSAILKMIGEISPSKYDEFEIEDIKLVYWVDRRGFRGLGEDTAVPAWKISTSSGDYYIGAYTN